MGSGGNTDTASDLLGNALPSGTVTFLAGQTSQTIMIAVNGDSTVEPDENFTVSLWRRPHTASLRDWSSAVCSSNLACTILNDDVALSIAATDATKSEG